MNNMTSIKELTVPKLNDLENVVREYWEGIQKTIEAESNKLKEIAEQDASQIVKKAEDEAKNIVAQAKEEAKLESERIINEAKRKAEQMAGKCREEAYAEALQESARIISDAREKVTQSITEAIGQSMTQMIDGFTKTASEAKSELEDGRSQVLAQLSKNFEDILIKNKAKIKAGFENPPPSSAEIETHEPPLVEKNTKKGEIKTRQTIAEAYLASSSAREKTKPAITPIEYKRDTPADGESDNKLYKGRLKVEIVYPFFKEPQWNAQHELTQIPGLKVISSDSYNRENNQVMSHIVEVAQPMPLLKTIKAAMPAEYVTELKGNIIVKAK